MRVKRIEILDTQEALENLSWAANLDLQIDKSVFGRLVTKAAKGGVHDFDQLVQDVVEGLSIYSLHSPALCL
jgi:hypothetical protein